ncbi:hypothetical protein [Methanoregula sp.]|jgi:uncharacterized protein Yka (UPF0111/DUF47 family)|uniref:hypothetical protein n=1 Tax=Methanoregula sp. TaxID=2052170 RepID=UPI003C7280A5
MAEKRDILHELGEDELLLPTLVNAALKANDRIKYLFTLLQAAKNHADNPDQSHSNLRAERESVGIIDPDFDTVVGGATKAGGKGYAIPLTGQIFQDISTAIEEMISPLISQNPAEVNRFNDRFTRLRMSLPSSGEEPVSGELINDITLAEKGRGTDSLHLLVMDLHKAINLLQTQIANEDIDGALGYLLADSDREMVRAFMTGVTRTAPLKFGHPGLGTIATRAGDKLVIQNDIGLTDAHVLVVTVKDQTVTITYTDIHLPRLHFFQSLFHPFPVQWSDTISRTPGKKFEVPVYHLSVGTYIARDAKDARDFLTHAGSRIVFLIDWNRARKRLRNFVPNADAIEILSSAAEEETGHIAFLELGGERLIYEALELASSIPLRYGEPLHEILGREQTMEYLQFVLRTASKGLLANTSHFLLQNEIRAELLRYFRTAHEGMMDLCEEHASYSIEIASIVLESLWLASDHIDPLVISRNAARGKEWEHNADDLVNRMRNLSQRIQNPEFFITLIATADDVADYLEEAGFFITLIPVHSDSKDIFFELRNLAELVLKGCRGYLKILIAAQEFHSTSQREDLKDLLTAVDEVFSVERLCDESLRRTERVIFEQCTDFKEFQLYLEIARTLEEASNTLLKVAFHVRDYMIESMNR